MDKRYIIGGLFFVAATIVGVVLMYPKFQVVQISSKIVEEKQNEFEAQMVLVQEISRLRSQQKQLTEEVSAVNDLLPVLSKKSVADLFVELEGIAAEGGLLLDTVSFSEVKKDAQKEKGKPVAVATHKTISAQLKLKGEYEDFKRFAQMIEANRHLMDIISVEVAGSSVGEEAPQEGEVVVLAESAQIYSVTIHAYYQ